MLEFKNFVGSMDLIDLLAFSRKFTCYKLDGLIISKLDRFILSEGLLTTWKVDNQFIASRSSSNHNPIYIKRNVVNRGPKPLKFFNCWMKHEDFLPFVANA